MTNIRKAGPDDAEKIIQLAKEIWEPTYDPILPKGQAKYMLDMIFDKESVKAQIRNNTQTYLLLYDNNEAVGFAAYAARPEQPKIYKLHKLYCLRNKQGRGYGKALIQAVEHEVRKAGSTVLELNVNRKNKAIQFYERMGYKVAYDEDIPIGPYWMNDHVMRKVLT